MNILTGGIMKRIEDLWQYDISKDIIIGNVENLQKEFDKGWNINEPLIKYAIEEGSYTLPLMLAIRHSNMKSVTFLIDHGASPDVEPDHAFIYAMRYAKEDMIRYVVKKGAKVKVYSNILNAYDYITQSNRIDYIPLALELGLPLNPYAERSFLREAANSNYENVDALIRHGININFNKKADWNPLGNTPLCHVACYGDEKMLKLLIDHGADPLIPNKSGQCPYLIALKQGKLKNAELLRSYEPCKTHPEEALIKKLPKDLINFLDKGDLKVFLKSLYGIEYIEFLAITDLAMLDFDGRKGILLTREIDNYPDICLLWNPRKKCVSYYEEEHRWYGDFGVSFQEFIEQPERYIKGIFTDEFTG
jgi:hypothetical protein